jgi:hypothetical protein
LVIAGEGTAVALEPAAEGEPAAEEAAGEGDAEEAATGAPAPAAASTPAAVAEGAPMVEVTPREKHVRHDWYVGFGFGAGVGLDTVPGSGRAVGGGGGGFLHAGGRIRDSLAIGARLFSSSARDLGSSGAMIEALFFPLAKRDKGLRISGGLGPGVVYALSQQAAPPGERTTAPALSLAGEIGYDLWVMRRFNVGFDLWTIGALSGRGRLATIGLGLSFNWY